MSKNGLSTEAFKDVPLDKFAIKHYKDYSAAVIEDRAFPDYRDGLNPVNRRLLWSAYELGIKSTGKSVKAARIVGDTLGRYHPHGDTTVYGAMVKMTNVSGTCNNVQVPLFEGDGNWGSLSDRSHAAMRYTEAKLSRFSDEILFNKFYTPVMDFVPNYDSSGKEPLVLPALLPIALINGRFGIAPSAQTNIPSCEYKSILKALHDIYAGQEITPEFLYKTLRFTSTYGGHEEKPVDADAKAKRRNIFTKYDGGTTIYSGMTYDEKTRTVTVTEFARDTDMEKLVTNLSDIEGIANVSDDSNTRDYYGKLTIVFKKGLKDSQYEKLLAYVKKFLSTTESYVLNFTERYIDDTGQSAASMKPMSLTEVITNWVKWRTELERKACSYWIKEDEKEIRRLELLAQAVDLIDVILKLLKDAKLSADQVYEAYAKKAKIKIEEAKYVLNRPIISLRRLEKKELEAKKREVETNKRKLEKRRNKPEPHMAEQIKGWVKLARG